MKEYDLTEKIIKNIVVGTGAAGYNAAIRLQQFGESDTAIVTENIFSGTSRNTGSDKQTYYKLSLAGDDSDCVKNLAADLFAGQCVDGDIALCEAALSARSFYHLVECGVPFPCNQYGEYMGYKTDHDRGRRATSAGPYTSKMMTEVLEKEAKNRQIPVLDKHQVIKVLTVTDEVQGILCLDTSFTEKLHYVVIWCENVIFAPGGPAGMYQDSVYPKSQQGSSGIAFEAGIKGKNLTEWQFGISSVKPRWNVSGTYMQVLPRFVSVGEDGEDQREFLYDFFTDEGELLSNVFLKGYQWPFDTNKIFGGSSIIDLLVYQESILKGRRVYLDFRSNPGAQEIDYRALSGEAHEYLQNAGACFGTPIERLAHMNEPAVAFYLEHGVDLYKEMLEIRICAQHNNGGLSADANWETNVKGFFAVGEVCGSHGVTRPGGSALNAGQVGALRAAECIAYRKSESQKGRMDVAEKRQLCKARIDECICLLAVDKENKENNQKLREIRKQASVRMSRFGGMIRSEAGIKEALEGTQNDLQKIKNGSWALTVKQAGMFYHVYDMLVAQDVYLQAMLDYIKHHGGSRGSALYSEAGGVLSDEKLPGLYRCKLDSGNLKGVIQEVVLADDGYQCKWRAVREIPDLDYFFETQWKEYRKRTFRNKSAE